MRTLRPAAAAAVVVMSVGCGGWRGKRAAERPWIQPGVAVAAAPDDAPASGVPVPRVSAGMMTGTVCSSDLCRGQYGALLVGFGLVTVHRAHAYHWVEVDTIVGLRELCAGYGCGGELPMTGAVNTGIGVHYGRVGGELGAGLIWAGDAIGDHRYLGVNALGGRAAVGVDVLRWRHGALAVNAEHHGALLPFGGVHATGVTVAVHHAVF